MLAGLPTRAAERGPFTVLPSVAAAPALGGDPERGRAGGRAHPRLEAFVRLDPGERRVSLPIIGQLLGHSQARTTQRYAHIADEAQRKAASRVGGAVRRKDNVVPLRRKTR